MSTQKNLITLCFAAVSTLGLAACGGGDASVTETTVIEPVVDTTLEEIAAEAAAVVAATKAAATKSTAINVEAKQTIDAYIGGSVMNDAGMVVDVDGTYSITIERDRDGTKITITDTANPADADPANPQFAQVMDFGDGRTMHTRTMDVNEDGEVITEVVIVSSDIEAPTATAFAMVMGQTLDVNTDTTNDEGGETFEAFGIAVDKGGDNNNADLALVKSSAFTVGTVAVLTFDAFNDVDMDEAFETAGTYNGAMGTYRCNGTTDCTVELDADGAITIMTGWVFTPATGATSDVADANYLDYGFWLKRTTDADGATTYNEVETFAGSSLVARVTTDVDGSATYEGGAVGVYVKNVFDSAGEIDTATSGHFKADASLTAIFGQMNNEADEGTIAPSLLNTLTGDITNFALQHNEANTWAVNLQGDIDTTDSSTAAGSANGGGDPGTFTANFHGALDDAPTVTPGAVTGEFNANFSNGSVAGGFGAREE